jgi:hypothetical protein
MNSFAKDWSRWSGAERLTAAAVLVASVLGLAGYVVFEVI